VRVHRRGLEKLVAAEAFACKACGRRTRRLHPRLVQRIGFICSTQTRCIRCGSIDVRRRTKLDRLESVSRSPASRLQQWTGAPVNWCAGCRLQYFDWRPPRVIYHDALNS
jgi:hypothetical protein